MTMSCLDKRSVCLRVTHHHRNLNSSCESLMDEADREVSSLTDRAFRSLCIGDEAVYNDAEFAGLSPSPVSCLLKPLADEYARKGPDNAHGKKHGSNGTATSAWQHKDMSSLLSAFTSGKNGDAAKIPNGMLGGNNVESWDKSALLSIQRELAEFSTDLHRSLADGSFTDTKKHSGSSEKKSTKKPSKDSTSTSSGKSSKSKHNKSSKLKKLNSRNFFLHSEFSPFQAWKDLNQFPFGQENISDLLPSDSFPRWCDSTLYRHLTATHTLSPAANIHNLTATHMPSSTAHTRDRSGALQGQVTGQRTEKSQKSEITPRSQHTQRPNLAHGTENVQGTENIQRVESAQRIENVQRVESGQKTDTVPKMETAQRTDTVQRIASPQRTESTQRTTEAAQTAEASQVTEAVPSLDSTAREEKRNRAESMVGLKPVGGRTEQPPRTVEVVPTPSALEQGRSSDSAVCSAPWRRNRNRANSSLAADRASSGPEPPRRQEVRRMEEQSSTSPTPFNITHLLTPVIPCRQDTESLDLSVLPNLFSPATLDVPAVAAIEPKPSPEMKARESYRSIASSLLFNLKDNRKRVKAMYSPPKFRPATEPADQSRMDAAPFSKDPTNTEAGTPEHGIATSPVLESTSTMALPGNQQSGRREVDGEMCGKDQLSVPDNIIQGGSPQGKQNRSPVVNRSEYPCLSLYKRASPVEADRSPRPDTNEVSMETQENRVVSVGQSSRPTKKEKENPKKSVRDRVKELQSLNATETQGNVSKNRAKKSKEKPPVCPVGLQTTDGTVDKGGGRETLKDRPPEVPAKPSVAHKPEKPKPAKQPPPVPPRMKHPPKSEQDLSAVNESREAAVGEMDSDREAKHAFSARQNNYIKSQRSTFAEDEEEHEEWDELREVALLKEMKVKLQARQEQQRAGAPTHGGRHTGGHTPKEMLLPPPPPPLPREDMLELNESLGAKNRPVVNSDDQEGLKQYDLASPSRTRKGVLTLRGNTLAKRDLFATMEQPNAHTQSSRHTQKENIVVNKYDLATMALEEVIADREERKRRGHGSTVEPPEKRQTSEPKQQGGGEGTKESGSVLSEQREREPSNVPRNRGKNTEDISVLRGGGQAMHSDQQAETTQGHAPRVKLAEAVYQQHLPSAKQIKHNKQGKAGERGLGADTDQTHTDRTGQGRGAAQANHTSEVERVQRQDSSEKEGRGDRKEKAGSERGSQKSRTPPAVPPRKGKPGMREEEDEKVAVERIRGNAAKYAEEETDNKDVENDLMHVDRKSKQKVDDVLRETPHKRQEAPLVMSKDKQKSSTKETNPVIEQDTTTATHTKPPTPTVTLTHTEKESLRGDTKSYERDADLTDNQCKTEAISRTEVLSESNSKPSEASQRHAPNEKECPGSPKVQAGISKSPLSKEEKSEKDEAYTQKGQKVQQGKSLMRDFLNLLGLAGEERENVDDRAAAERDNGKHCPESPDLPSTHALMADGVTIHDILKHRSPVYSPLQSPVRSPSIYSDHSSQKHSVLEGTLKAGQREGLDLVAGCSDVSKPKENYCTFSNPGSESDASERPITSPLSELDKGGWVRSLIEHAQNLTPKNLTPKNLTPLSLTPSQSTASSPTPARPVLFKVKDNTFVTSPVTKTVRPILHKSIQDLMAKPWSPMSGSDRGSERGEEEPRGGLGIPKLWSPRESLSGSERGEEDPPVPPEPQREVLGIPIVVETASSPLSERSHSVPVEGAAAPGPPSTSPLPGGVQMLTVPLDEGGRGSTSSGLSSGLSEGIEGYDTSVGDGGDEVGRSMAHLEDTEGSKAPSERSGSVCSGTEGSGQSRKPPPAVLPKTEKALRRAMRLTNRRIQKAEGKSKGDRANSSGEGTEPDQKNRSREKQEHEQKNRSKEQPEMEPENRVRERTGSEKKRLSTEKHARHKSEHSGHRSNRHSSSSGHHDDRKGRSSEKHAHVKHEQKSYSSDRHIGNHRGHEKNSTEQVSEQQQQVNMRESPSGIHGDRRSRSLERDLLVQHEGLPHHWHQHQSHDPNHTGGDIASVESSTPSSRRTSLSGLLARQNSSEHTYPTSNLVSQAFPMTQRKLLQDPDSGQYFVVDMPVQVKTKTFFDPETGSYVQLPVQSPEGAVPPAPSMEMLNPSLVVYHGYMPMPVSSLAQPTPTAKSSAPMALSGDVQDMDNSATQWQDDCLHNCGRNEHPYIEPVYVPKDRTPEEELDSVR